MAHDSLRLSVALVALALLGAAPTVSTNLDFEQGDPGEAPPGWIVPTWSVGHGYTATLSDAGAHAGRQCVMLARGADAPPGREGFGNVMASLDATPYRGKRVRFRGWVKTSGTKPGDRAQLWLRVDRPGGANGFFDNMNDRPIRSADWQEYSIDGTVDADAELVNFGMMLLGDGLAWLDDVAFEVLGASGEGDRPPRPLAPRGLENLGAATKLLGYVRYFHPSDEAARIDWNRFAVDAVPIVEQAQNPEDLARALETLFAPIAPTVRVYPTGRARPALPGALKPAGGAEPSKVIAWRHLGVSAGSDGGTYSSRRVSSDDAPEPGRALTVKILDATPYRGRPLRISGRVRAQVAGAGNAAHLGLAVYRDDFVPGGASGVDDRPITSAEWRAYEATVEVDPDARQIYACIGVEGRGQAWFEDVRLDVPAENGSPSEPERFRFEGASEEEAPAGWSLLASPPASGHLSACSGGDDRCLVLSRAGPAAPALPDPAAPFEGSLGAGVSCLVPLALYADTAGTLPRAASSVGSSRPDGWVPSAGDRATRLAAVSVAWNVFQHFYPYFDAVATDWPAVLRGSLTAAATDAGEADFLATLRRMTHELHDGHVRVHAGADGSTHRLPLLWEWIEERLVVTHVFESGSAGLNRGDVIVSVDGQPAADALREREALISSATPQWARYRALTEMASGPEGSAVALEVLSPAPRRVVLRRTVPVHEAGLRSEPRPPNFQEVAPGIVYFDVATATDLEFRHAVPALAGARGIVIDVRGYPALRFTAILAHLFDPDRRVKSAQWHIPVVTRPDRDGLEFQVSDWSVEAEAPRFAGKVAFLTDGRAISAAETFLGIVEHHRLGEIVGSPTAGTNGNVTSIKLPGGYSVSFTGMRVLKQDGSRHHGVGILPTVPASRTVRGVALGKDEVLERAIALMAVKQAARLSIDRASPPRAGVTGAVGIQRWRPLSPVSQAAVGATTTRDLSRQRFVAPTAPLAVDPTH